MENINGTDFIIKIDYNQRSTKPAHVFSVMSEMIGSFNILDSALLSSIDSKIQPLIMLENVETGSIISRFKYLLEDTPDDAIRNLDWKQMIGEYLIKAKYAIIDFINKTESISTSSDVEELEKKIMDLSKDANIKELSSHGIIDRQRLLTGISKISNAINQIEDNEKLTYIIGEKEITLSLTFQFESNQIEDLLTAETLSSESEMFLKIKKPDYLGDSKWEFRHGKIAISANILDSDWIARFRNREIALKPGDSIRAVVKADVKYDYDREVTSINHNIIKIVDVIYSKSNSQNQLF